MAFGALRKARRIGNQVKILNCARNCKSQPSGFNH